MEMEKEGEKVQYFSKSKDLVRSHRGEDLPVYANIESVHEETQCLTDALLDLNWSTLSIRGCRPGRTSTKGRS